MDDRKKPEKLMEVIQAALPQADTYDRQLFESINVKTLWLESYEDIPEILKDIAQDRRGPQSCTMGATHSSARLVQTGDAT